jgi:hypothetical protein
MQCETAEEFVVIVRTANDCIVECVKNKFFNIKKYLRQRKLVGGTVEVITKQEFNRRLDEIMLIY